MSRMRMAMSAVIVDGIGGDHVKSTARGEVPADRSAPVAPPGAVSPGSAALSAHPRRVMIEHFFAAALRALDASDLEAARVAHRAAGELLGEPAPRAGVVDLDRERRRRG